MPWPQHAVWVMPPGRGRAGIRWRSGRSVPDTAGQDSSAVAGWGSRSMGRCRQLGDEDTETPRRIMTDLSWLIVDAGTFDPRAFMLPRTPLDPAVRTA